MCHWICFITAPLSSLHACQTSCLPAFQVSIPRASAAAQHSTQHQASYPSHGLSPVPGYMCNAEPTSPHQASRVGATHTSTTAQPSPCKQSWKVSRDPDEPAAPLLTPANPSRKPGPSSVLHFCTVGLVLAVQYNTVLIMAVAHPCHRGPEHTHSTLPCTNPLKMH